MSFVRHRFAALVLSVVSGLLSITHAAEPDELGVLAGYVARTEPSFEWREMNSGRIGKTEYVEYLLTSQTWREIPWKHQLFVLRPASMSRSATQGFLFIHGGRWRAEYESADRKSALPREAKLFARLAEDIGAPLAVLRQVPFAPIFDRREDALIAYTFDRYLETGEETWPLLLPMTKSAVNAMTAVQEIVRERWGASIDSFTVSGASKRGWTAWLTAALDPRVAAVAPMVIDVLNMDEQMAHQRAVWGELSEEINDYSALNVPERLKTPRGEALLSIVDPYEYRERLSDQKLIMLSTNDRYWPLDALKFYWPELPAPKHVLYVPNQGHSLRDVGRVIGALSALHRYSASGETLPDTNWRFEVAPDAFTINVDTQRPPRQVRIWTARSETLDFRDSHWAARRCKRNGDGYLCRAPRPAEGYAAVFAEAAFKDSGHAPFSITTTVCLAGPEVSKATQC